MLRYDYTVQKDIPNYCFILAAFCVWAYSTLDAIDGKQARRTKSSSPLGQLFDHGCDSFATAFFILALGQAFKLEGFEMLSIFVSAQIAFWSASWMEHHTGILVTNVGQFGVTESHLIAISVHLLTGIFGQQLW
jgi:phosphatidylglycerophosphate synthase